MKNFNHYFIDTLKKRYADFNGSATRSEYWYFVLFYVIIAFVLSMIDIYIINPMMGMSASESKDGGLLQMLFVLTMLVPSLAIAIRRLHDIGKSAWFMLIGFIPLLGGLVLLYFFVQKTKR